MNFNKHEAIRKRVYIIPILLAVILTRNQKVTQYLGIPYAQAPIGKLRFSPPSTDPLPTWNGVRNTSQFAPSCYQVLNRPKLHEKLFLQLLVEQPTLAVSEDCLYLNLFIPDGNRPSGGWPVMVWFHGGDFNTGTPTIWDASVFVMKEKVLVVTVAYRLNILGFFTTMDAEAPGNYGMYDQLAAMDWIRRNIGSFDGSTSNIVIYGHSSGAISVGLHMVSPMSKGKFSKAVAMSGDAVGSVRTPDLEAPVVDIIADKFGCYRRPTSALMECLRRVNVDLLVTQSAEIETWGPIVDADTNNGSEPFLPDHPKNVLENGNFNAVPLIVGYTNNEQALAYIESLGRDDTDGSLSKKKFDTMVVDESIAALSAPNPNSTCEYRPEIVAEAVLFFYRPHPLSHDQSVLRDRYLSLQTDKSFASGLTFIAGKVAYQQSAFVYKFDYRLKTQSISRDVPEWAGVPHMFELPFIWGLPHTVGGNVQWNSADKKTSDGMMSMLANFARTGNPSLPTIKWQPYTEDNPAILIVDRNIEMGESSSIDYKALAFWNEYYPQVVESATRCCNVTSDSIAWRFSYKLYLISFLSTTISQRCFKL